MDSSDIGSFSKKGNDLGQYRVYGNYCIGFDASKLVRRGFELVECEYDSKKIKDWILLKEKVDEWKGPLHDWEKDCAAGHLLEAARRKFKGKDFESEEEVRIVAQSVSGKWGQWQKRFPNSALAMSSGFPPVYFRDHPIHKCPVPYVKFFLTNEECDIDDHASISYQEMRERKLQFETRCKRKRLPITDIIVGPMADQSTAKVSCEMLISAMGYLDVEVLDSKIPYRG